MSDIAIKVERVSKTFKLPHERHSTLKQAALNWRKRSYEKLNVLDGIDFEVKKGEFFGILGKNGSGKSTLLKILAGIYQPTSGGTLVNGRLTPFIELGVGFDPELTGRDNVFLNGTILGLSKKELEKHYNKIVEFAELQRFMDQKLKNYSSGMQVRLAFSIAIQAHSDILLIDEVLAVGDAGFQAKCLDVFRFLKKQGKTIIFVSHDMSVISEFCTRGIVLERGSLTFNGPPKSAIKKYLNQVNKETKKTQSPYSIKSLAPRITNKAKITNGRIEDSKGQETTVIGNDGFTVKFDAEFYEDAENPIPGIIIISEYGLQISAANNLWVRQKTGKFKKGDKVSFGFQFANFLEAGHYKIIANLIYEDKVRIYDWDNNLVKFVSKKPFQTDSVVHTPYKFYVNKKLSDKSHA